MMKWGLSLAVVFANFVLGILLWYWGFIPAYAILLWMGFAFLFAFLFIRYRDSWLNFYRSDAEKGGWNKRYGQPAGILIAFLSVAFGLLIKTPIVYEQWFPYVTLSYILVVLFLGCVLVAALMKTFGKWMIMILIVPVLIALLYNWILRLLP